MTTTTTTTSEAQTIALAQEFAAALRPGDVVALHGDLGAGKTRFVRGLARGLGINPRLVSSPTFVLVHEYPAGPRSVPLIHMDAYRLTPGDDLETLDWERLVAPDAPHVLVVEWAERIAASLPTPRIEVTIHHAGGDERRIEISRVDAGA